jgi:hypothetical protein
MPKPTPARSRDASATPRAAATPMPVQRADDAAMPEDIDAFRIALTRRILTHVGMARRCREPACRRARRCAGRDLRCLREHPLPPTSAQDQSRLMAKLQRALAQRLAQDGDVKDGAP